MEQIFDGKYNAILDNLAVRIAAITVGFGLWLAVSLALMSL